MWVGRERGQGAVRALGAVSAVGAGGAGGRVGAAIEHYSSLFFGGASLFLGGREDMWAVRAVGMEACGRWGRWVYRTLDSLSAGGEEDMYADGAVGVLEERKACGRRGRWVRWERCCGW